MYTSQLISMNLSFVFKTSQLNLLSLGWFSTTYDENKNDRSATLISQITLPRKNLWPSCLFCDAKWNCLKSAKRHDKLDHFLFSSFLTFNSTTFAVFSLNFTKIPLFLTINRSAFSGLLLNFTISHRINSKYKHIILPQCSFIRSVPSVTEQRGRISNSVLNILTANYPNVHHFV